MWPSLVGRLTHLVLALGLVLASSSPARAAASDEPDEQVTLAGLNVAVWKPSSGTGPFPLVLFSHGLWGCKTQSNYLMRALAERGMLVAAPDHKDVSLACPKALVPSSLAFDLVIRLYWNPNLRKDRRDDIRELRTALGTSTTYGRLIDPNRTALVGHSLGGYTVLGLAGGWPGWKMNGVTAVVALASYARPLLAKGQLETVSTPVMIQGGKKDDYAPSSWQELVYDTVEAPGCEVIYDEAEHFAWTALDRVGSYHDHTARSVGNFLEAAFEGRVATVADVPPSNLASIECR